MLLPSALQTINNSLRVLTYTCVIGSLQMYKTLGNKHLKLIFQHSVSPFPSNCLITEKHKGLLTVAKCESQRKGGNYRLKNTRISKQFLSISKDNIKTSFIT